MKHFIIFLLIVLPFAHMAAQEGSPEVIYWELNRLDSIGGFPVTQIGNPSLIETSLGTAIEFNGTSDGIRIPSNPLAGSEEFTVEVIFKPYAGGLEEQRFVHMEQDNENRMLIELRSTAEDDWFLDTFIKSGASSRTLYAENFPHVKDSFWHAALVYKDSVMTHYVNGRKEMTDFVVYQQQSSGTTSIGVRNNLVSWYKGAIKSLKITHKALTPEEFSIMDTTVNTTPDILGTVASDSFKLESSILPNPVSDFTRLAYSVYSQSRVIIRVYDIRQNLISEPLNQVCVPGSHTLDLNFTSLHQGVYFYTIQEDQHLVTKKFLVIH